MICLAVALFLQDEVGRTPAIYRCPAKEAESPKLAQALEDGYDALCVDPSPGPKARTAVKEARIKFFDPKLIDTTANRKWRDATIAFVNARISPAEWLSRMRGLGETVHYLSSPSTPELRAATPSLEMDGAYSARAVFGELLLLVWTGRVCFTSTDTYDTRQWPDNDRFESWILAMHDHLGPMLSMRHDDPFLVTQKPDVLRADTKPGLLVFRHTMGKHVMTFYLNNSPLPIELPKIDTDKVTLSRGLNLDGEKPVINPTGVIIEDVGGD